MSWAKDKIIPSYGEIMGRLAYLKNKEPMPDKLMSVELNNKQREFRDIVVNGVKEWFLAKQGKGPWPKPSRVLLAGGPGTGKSVCVRAAMAELQAFLGSDFNYFIKQGTPTGCASFHMGAGATTVHKLFGLNPKSKRGDIDAKTVKFLTEQFKFGLAVLLIDEASMESRSHFGLVISRLIAAKVDLERVGFIFILDPAQLFPVAGEPPWSIKIKRLDKKDFTEDSLYGLTEFRAIFRMPKLQQVSGFDDWNKNEMCKNPQKPRGNKLVHSLLGLYLEIMTQYI